MKTLHLTNAWHASSGGIGTFYKALFETANRERHSMRLVVPGDWTRAEEVGEFGRVYYIEAPRAPLNPQYRMIYPHRFLFPATALQRIINEEQPDLIEVSEKYTLLWLAGLLRTRRLPGVRVRPTVVGASHERMDENLAAYLTPHPLGGRFCAWYMKAFYFPMFDHHIAVSEHTAAELIQASRGHKVRRGIWVAPMGVDWDRFTPELRSAAMRNRLLELVGGHEGTTVLLYAGRLAPEKNLPLLIEIMRRLPAGDYRLGIAGEGTLFKTLQALAERNGLKNVTFLGHIPDRDLLAGYYANADIFIHPNPREPFGIAPLEAMAAGLALVAPNSGGVTSYANDGNSWLSAADPDLMAQSVRSIREDSELRAARTTAARATAEQFRWPNVTTAYLRLYREIHALTQGEQVVMTLPAKTYSTPGDAFGRELINL